MGKILPSDTVSLSNGVKMPIFGLGTEAIGMEVYNSKTQRELFAKAIEIGYRFFDTAETHGVYRALGKEIRQSGIPRKDFFIASKMRVDEMGDGRFYQAVNETLVQLGLDYLDLYSIHWPLILNRQWPKVPSYVGAYVGREILKTDNGDADGLISLYEKKLTRAIGVCNMEIPHLETILSNPKCTVPPMVLQSHFHPLYAAKELREYCQAKGIAFGGLFEADQTQQYTKQQVFTDVNRYGLMFQTDDDHIMANNSVRIHPTRRSTEYQTDPYARDRNPRRPGKRFYDDVDAVRAFAQKYGKNCTQIVTRWSLQKGVVTAPVAMLAREMQDNFNVFDFELDEADMARLDAFDVGLRVGYHPDYIDF